MDPSKARPSQHGETAEHDEQHERGVHDQDGIGCEAKPHALDYASVDVLIQLPLNAECADFLRNNFHKNGLSRTTP